MERKKKICIECNTPQFIWSKKRCKGCASKTYKPISQKKKATGEKEVFFEIWQERPHICTNCKAQLGDEAKSHHFAHIIAKGKNEALRLVKTNIMLHCFKCHFAYDHETKEKYHSRTDLYLTTNHYEQ